MTITEDRADCIRQYHDARMRLADSEHTETRDSAVAGIARAEANIDRYAWRYAAYLLDPEGEEKAGNRAGTSTLQGGRR
jgi:hypothetical protein